MKTRIFNLLVLDESGSMGSIEKQAVDSVNETLQSVRSAQEKYPEQEHYVSFVTFNSDGIKTVLDCVEARKVEDITPAQKANRRLLRAGMLAAGFEDYSEEWWHYTLPSDAPKVYYDFPIE